MLFGLIHSLVAPRWIGGIGGEYPTPGTTNEILILVAAKLTALEQFTRPMST